MVGGQFVKRLCDVVIAGLLLLITLPMIVVCALGAAIALRSSPFFTQRRVGRDGKEFRFLKLRTLPPYAPQYATKYELGEVQIPRFCQALRRLHLDELPQLFLVMIGKMSLVGPRPEMGYLYAEFTDDFARERTSVRPGCTGLWQVSEHCQKMIHEHPEFDAHYLRNRSLRLDLWIVLRTLQMHLPGGQKRLVTLPALPAWARKDQPVEFERHAPKRTRSIEVRPRPADLTIASVDLTIRAADLTITTPELSIATADA